MDLLLAFFVVMGAILFLWCLLGILLAPVFGPGMVTFYEVSGDGSVLEHQVRSFGWFREGELTGGRLVIVDRGLSEKGRRVASALCEKYTWLTVIKGDVPGFEDQRETIWRI